MTIWIDRPIWPRHGTTFAHLVSDESLAELHAFAARAGLHPRSFEGDHYDVPQERYAAALAAGATCVPGRELVRRLSASGLRLRKRRGDRPVARVTGVTFPDGTRADVDLVASDRLLEAPAVFAGMVFLQDLDGRFAVVHTPRRRSWGSPGGWCEPAEHVADAAARETWEEAGIRVARTRLRPCGYERFEVQGEVRGRWLPGRSYLQVFRARLGQALPSLRPAADDVDEARWVDLAGFRALCGGEFWWPLAEHLFGPVPGKGARST